MLGSISNLDYCNLQSKSLYRVFVYKYQLYQTDVPSTNSICRSEISRTDMQFQKQFKIYILNYILPVNITTLLQHVYYVYYNIYKLKIKACINCQRFKIDCDIILNNKQ